MMLIPRDLWASSHQDYATLVWNTWVIWCLEERGTKRENISRVNTYTSRIFFIQKKVIFKDPPSPPIFRAVFEI